MTSQTRSVFANRSFSLYYAGQVLSFAGDGLRLIAIPLLVYHLTRSAFSMGVTYALELGPFALFGLVGGSLADRVDRRRLMLVCDFVRFATLALFAVAYAFNFLSLGMIYGGIVMISICAAVFVGGQASSLPYLLGKDRVTQAVGVLIAAEQTSQMVIPPIGASMFALVGPLPALAINAATYLCSQLSIAAVHTFGPDEPGRLPKPHQIVADVALGFRFLMGDAAMRSVALNSLVFNFFGFMTGAVFIPFLNRDFGATDQMVGYAFGIGAIGSVIGSALGGFVPKSWPFGRILVIAYALDGVLFIPVVFTHQLYVAIFFLTLTNACVLFEITQIVGWRIRVTPAEMVGRVSAAARLVALFGTVPGAIIGGLLADHYGARVPIAISGVGYLLMTLLVGFNPAIRREAR
ncbi:MAG: MFS transporter [Candidatus Eremiobacteraeota bacterium]|nr:MFS transporter [Candidatus Eremiobacteraeota bacterium]